MSAVASTVVAVATPAAAADPIGPNQYFVGLVNGRTAQSSIRVACLGPVRPGALGRPVPGQTVMVRLAPWTGPTPMGFTGSAARAIVALLSPSATNDPSVTMTEYNVAAPIPTHITLPCTGTGQVFFFARPTSPTARATGVEVTFVST
jgi:hypothetical protein